MLRRYVPGGLDQPLIWFEGTGTSSSSARWLLNDAAGSIIAVGTTGSSNTTLAINTFDEYGVNGSSNLGRFGYKAMAWIPEAGLYHARARARAYDPAIGRFMQSDPVGYQDGMNFYAWVHNDPVNGSDPWGLQDAGSVPEPPAPLVAEVIVIAAPLVNIASNYLSNSLLVAQTWLFSASGPALLPQNVTCSGPARVSADGTGPHQAPYTGHTGSLYPPIAGGAMGTVAVQNNFLGIGRSGLRKYGTQITISFGDENQITSTGGPAGPYTVSDRGDIKINNDPTVRFDLYRWDSTPDALKFGVRSTTATVTFPAASGGMCPSGWSQN